MAIRVVWDNGAESAIRYELGGSWSWDAIQEANEVAYQLISRAHYSVDIVVYFDSYQNYPKEVALSYAQHIALAARHYPNFSGNLIIVGIDSANAVYDQRTRYQQTRALSDVDTFFCNSLSDAHDLMEYGGFESIAAI